jgi:hypothetical protein
MHRRRGAQKQAAATRLGILCCVDTAVRARWSRRRADMERRGRAVFTHICCLVGADARSGGVVACIPLKLPPRRGLRVCRRNCRPRRGHGAACLGIRCEAGCGTTCASHRLVGVCEPFGLADNTIGEGVPASRKKLEASRSEASGAWGIDGSYDGSGIGAFMTFRLRVQKSGTPE